ncbi:ABC transporter permease [Paenibacillus sp. MMS20-IR301]|uniref:ABC transporter permease n=1 Tax=Paenibacillus sp. MMS20-IR301 TaxID=2895946 RepID=UPI0028E471CD|nr:ABC transporter permease [Paenibacillus sp. MMS20-IR301]WNS41670.1 ABC transporter permease [Paenibacillus sp. MMS20-IR301]
MSRNSFAFSTAGSLFRRRLASHFREQTTIIRTAVDWTVLLYIIIPGGLLGGRFYYGFWKGELPAWISSVPFMAAPILLALLLATGGIVLLLQEGDLLFLRQRQDWISTIIARGMLYSLIVTSLKMAAAYAVLLPFLIKGYGISAAGAYGLLALTVTSSWCIKLLAHLVKVQRQGFRRWLWLIPAVTVSCGIYLRVAVVYKDSPLQLFAVAAGFAAVAAAAFRARLQLRGTFINDVREDYKQRMKIAAIMLRGVLDKPRPTRYKPWIFRKSQPLLAAKEPESRFAAAAIKGLLRNPAHFKLYLQFTGVALIAILIVPTVLKWLLFAVLTALMAYWLSSFWLLFSGDDYIGILPFTKGQKADAGSKAMPILLMPFAVLCAAAVCIPAYSWWGLLLFVPVGAAAAYGIANVFSAMRFAR